MVSMINPLCTARLVGYFQSDNVHRLSTSAEFGAKKNFLLVSGLVIGQWKRERERSIIMGLFLTWSFTFDWFYIPIRG